MKKKDILKNAILKNIADKDTVLNCIFGNNELNNRNVIDIQEFYSRVQPVILPKRKRLGYTLINCVLAAAFLMGSAFIGYKTYLKNTPELLSGDSANFYKQIEAARKKTLKIKSGVIRFDEYIWAQENTGAFDYKGAVQILFNNDDYDYHLTETVCDGPDISRDKEATSTSSFRKVSGTLFQSVDNTTWTPVNLSTEKDDYRSHIDGIITIEFLLQRINISKDIIISIDCEYLADRTIYTVTAKGSGNGNDTITYDINSEGIISNITASFTPYFISEFPQRIPFEMMYRTSKQFKEHTLTAVIESCEVTIESPYAESSIQ